MSKASVPVRRKSVSSFFWSTQRPSRCCRKNLISVLASPQERVSRNLRGFYVRRSRCSPTRNDPGKKCPEPNHLVFCVPVRADNARSLHFRCCPHHRDGFARCSPGSQRISARNPNWVVHRTIRDTCVRLSDGSCFGDRVRSLQFSTDSPVSRLARLPTQRSERWHPLIYFS